MSAWIVRVNHCWEPTSLRADDGRVHGRCFRRRVASTSAKEWAQVFDNPSRPYQFAFGARAGTNAFAASPRAALSLRPTAVVVSVDGRCAYASMSHIAFPSNRQSFSLACFFLGFQLLLEETRFFFRPSNRTPRLCVRAHTSSKTHAGGTQAPAAVARTLGTLATQHNAAGSCSPWVPPQCQPLRTLPSARQRFGGGEALVEPAFASASAPGRLPSVRGD